MAPGVVAAVEEAAVSENAGPTLLRYIYLIRRVQEATQQEERVAPAILLIFLHKTYHGVSISVGFLFPS